MSVRLVSVRLGRFMERSGVLPTTQFAYRKGLGTCDALLCTSHTLQSALESGQEARIFQIAFSAAFEGLRSLAFSAAFERLAAQPQPTIREFCISSVLWVLKVLCCLY